MKELRLRQAAAVKPAPGFRVTGRGPGCFLAADTSVRQHRDGILAAIRLGLSQNGIGLRTHPGQRGASSLGKKPGEGRKGDVCQVRLAMVQFIHFIDIAHVQDDLRPACGASSDDFTWTTIPAVTTCRACVLSIQASRIPEIPSRTERRRARSRLPRPSS
jgi:hypothetical protein